MAFIEVVMLNFDKNRRYGRLQRKNTKGLQQLF